MGEKNLVEMLDETADTFAKGELTQGVAQFQEIIIALPKDRFGEVCGAILDASCLEMKHYGAERLDYVVLALHTIQMGKCA